MFSGRSDRFAVVARTIPVDQYAGAAEIAARLGSDRTTFVHDLRRQHPDFPYAVATLKAGLVWAWPGVES